MSESGIDSNDIPTQFREKLEPEETLEYIAETKNGTVVATDRRLLIEQEIDVGALEYDEIVSVDAVTLRNRNMKFWAGIILLILSIPGLIQGATGAILALFPVAIILLFLWYKGNKVVQIELSSREEPYHLQFNDIRGAAKQINELRTSQG